MHKLLLAGVLLFAAVATAADPPTEKPFEYEYHEATDNPADQEVAPISGAPAPVRVAPMGAPELTYTVAGACDDCHTKAAEAPRDDGEVPKLATGNNNNRHTIRLRRVPKYHEYAGCDTTRPLTAADRQAISGHKYAAWTTGSTAPLRQLRATFNDCKLDRFTPVANAPWETCTIDAATNRLTCDSEAPPDAVRSAAAGAPPNT